jgi:predicted aspartyl protease
MTHGGHFFRSIISLVAVLAAPAIAAPEATPPPPVVPSEVIPTLDDLAMRMTVPVMINGQGPFQFVIDTGASRTVISTALADRLGLKAGASARLHSMGGVDQVRTVIIPKLQVSSGIARDIIAPALSGENLGADGLLGLDALKGLRIVMDFRARTMTVSPSQKKEEPSEPGTIVVTAKSRFGQLILTNADANGRSVDVVIDTGAQNTVGNTPLRAILLKRQLKNPFVQIDLLSVTGRHTTAEYTQIDAVRIGGVAMTNAPTAFADAHPFRQFGLANKPAMLLGMDLLRKFERVSVDFASRKIRFSLPKAETGI